MNGLARAKFMDKLMTVVFYCVAGFFILLLVGLALYVIGNGFRNFSFSLISFEAAAWEICFSIRCIWFSCHCWSACRWA